MLSGTYYTVQHLCYTVHCSREEQFPVSLGMYTISRIQAASTGLWPSETVQVRYKRKMMK